MRTKTWSVSSWSQDSSASSALEGNKRGGLLMTTLPAENATRPNGKLFPALICVPPLTHFLRLARVVAPTFTFQIPSLHSFFPVLLCKATASLRPRAKTQTHSLSQSSGHLASCHCLPPGTRGTRTHLSHVNELRCDNLSFANRRAKGCGLWAVRQAVCWAPQQGWHFQKGSHLC